jgi:hypothetical protein
VIWTCRFCDYDEGEPVKALGPRPSTQTVLICPACRGGAE